MGQHSFIKSTLLALSLFAHTVLSAQLVKDGTGSCTTYPKSVYRAYNYRPFCGTLAPAEYLPRTTGGVCDTALSVYRSLPETFALFDITGVRVPDSFPIGMGTELCMCYSMTEAAPATGAPRKANFCTHIDRVGAEKMYGTWAHGAFEIGSKAMPQCFEVDIAAVTASIAASQASATTISTPPDLTNTPTTPGTVRTGAPAPSTGLNPAATGLSNKDTNAAGPSATSQSSSSSSTGPLGIAIWLPILISIIGLLIGFWYKHRTYTLNKKNAHKAGYQQSA